MNNIIKHAKKAKTAFETYINDEYDYQTCERAYHLIMNIELLNVDEEHELDDFIYKNSISYNIYTNLNKKRFIRMFPLTLSTPTANIYQANGDLLVLKSKENKQKTKTYPKKAA